MSTQNSITSVVEQFMRLERNALEIISKISEVTTSSNETVQFSLVQDDGTTQTYLVPSFGSMKANIDRVDRNTQQLAGLGDSNTTIKMPDGTTKKIFEASVLRDPAPIESLQVPAQFKIKNNWFFEKFLNPLLYVSFDVTDLVPDDMRQAYCKRIIVNTDTQDKKDYFDTEFKGKNDITYTDLLIKLDANAIDFFTDEEIVDLPVSVMRYRGTFDVIKVLDEETNITSNGQTITTKKRKYKLSSITYTDILSGTTDSKTIQLNDVLITSDGSKYNVDSIDAAENTVVLKRLSGNQSITIGTDILTIYSPPYTIKEIQVNIGFDERQVIFLKPIDYKFDVASSQYSPGVGFYSNDLLIGTASGNQSLESFYKDQVTDFGQQFINSAKEKQIPSVYGEIPDAPVLDSTNFKVVVINSHKKDTKEIDDIKQKLATKVQLENQIKGLDEAINNKKNDLNNNSSTKSDAEKRKIKQDLDTLAKEKSSKVNLYSSVVKELSTKAKENPVVAEGNKFRVRGFWPIPAAKNSDKTQPQEIIQFKIAYRYIRKDGNAPGTEKMDFTDNDGTTKSGYFSNWTWYKTDIRKRIYNTDTGFYEWIIEDVSDADTVNINQLDISISKGEQLQVRIKSISEAGYPLNPLESDWSSVITIDFPDDLQIQDDSSTILAEIANEDTRVKFQEELNSRGLDLHLLSSFTSGDQYYGHHATDIASDFFTPEGKVINLFEKIKQMDNELQAIKQLIQKAKGTLVVYLLDEIGNVTKISANSTTKLFAGFYKDLIKSGSGNSIVFNHGQIITKNYVIRLENSAATPLELISVLSGGLGEALPVSVPSAPVTSADYDKNRRYDLVPISLSGINQVSSGSLKQVAPFQTQQVKSLWMYDRFKSVGLDEELYVDWSAVNTNAVSGSYNYQGVTISSDLVPLNGYHLLPFDPSFNVPGSTTNANVWAGTITGTSSNGGGFLSEFCIHKDHPELISTDTISTYTGGTNWSTQTYKTSALTADGAGGYIMKYPKFIHALYFNDDITQTHGRKQLQKQVPAVASSPTTNDTMFPPKLGFISNDEYLIGKYTCGAYLYTAPVDYTDIAVDGSNDLAKRTLEFGEDKGINIPLIYQFRCSDKLGYVGGYRLSGNITNITYTKKVGIDIQVRGESLLSFDIEVTSKYASDSLVQNVYIPNAGLERLSAIRTQSVNTGLTSSI